MTVAVALADGFVEIPESLVELAETKIRIDESPGWRYLTIEEFNEGVTSKVTKHLPGGHDQQSHGNRGGKTAKELGIPEPWRDNHTAKFTELVRVSDLKKWIEFDRLAQDPNRVERLADEIAENGFTDEVLIEVRQTELGMDSRQADVLLVEGNHRLAAAEFLGLSHIPAKVLTTDANPIGSGFGHLIHDERKDWRRVQLKITVKDAWRGSGFKKPSTVFRTADIDKVRKHLPGQHDQLSHGRRGVNSQQGGGIGASDLTAYLTSVADFAEEQGQPSFEAMVLQRGKHFVGPTEQENRSLMRDWGVEHGELGDCFMNAQSHVMFGDGGEDLTYVEGYAIASNVPIAIHHAWLVTPDGKVIDPTWRGQSDVNPGVEYYGIPFDNEWLRLRAVETEVWGVFGTGGLSEEEFDDAIAA